MTCVAAEALALRVLMPSFAGPTLPEDYAALLAEGLGGITLFGSNVVDSEQVASLTAAIHAANPGAVVSIDEEGGDVTRLHTAAGSPVPGAAALGFVDDERWTHHVGRLVGADLAAHGIDLDLAPVADVNSNPGNPVIGTRSFAASPQTAATHVAAWVEGLQELGVAACVKHFPGHGDTGQDSHLELATLAVSREVLEARELAPFRAAIASGARSVMTSHIVVPALDADLPATLSPAVLGLLREEYDGVIVTDALDMAGASAGRGIPAAAVMALAAGADLLCIGPEKPAALVREIQAAILAAVDEGTLPLARLDEAAGRAATLRARTRHTGIDHDPTGADMVRLAARAVTVEGELPDLAGARVVDIDTPANIAVGDIPWGLPADVAVTPAGGLPPGLAGAVVVQVRDAHRRPEVAETLERLAELGAHPVVIEWGWPGPSAGRFPRICTRGCSAPAVAAVTDLLREAGWDR